MTITENSNLKDYEEYSKKVLNNLINNGNNGSDPSGVAQVIYKAATDNKKKMRYKAGKMKNMITMRKMLPLPLYRVIVKSTLEK